MHSLKTVEVHLSLPVFFLLSFAVCSETVRSRFGIDFSFVLLIAITLYYLFCYKYAIRGINSYYWWFYILLVPVLLATTWNGGDILHMIACALILLLPLTLEPFLPWDDEIIVKESYLIMLVSVVIIILYANVGFLENWNTNCVGYLSFLGVAAATLILAKNRRNVFVWVVYIFAAVQLMVTDSRNVSYAIIITIILLIFKDFLKRRAVFRFVYGFAILYPAIFPHIANAMAETELYNMLTEITVNVYGKNSGLLSGRGAMYDGAQELINESLVGNLFGYGRTMVSFYASHNDYYLIRYTFGLIGTVVIAVVLIVFFEKSYELIRNYDDIAYGCFAVIISVLFQQASEGWFLATYLLTLMPFVYMAIIVKRYRILMTTDEEIVNEEERENSWL